MQIIDLNDEFIPEFLICLEEWSTDMKDAGNYRSEWLQEMRSKGLRIKLATMDDGKIAGFIQYAPVEHTHVLGSDCYFIYCIWIHGHKAGRGDLRRRGMGSALLKAAESDTRALGTKGLACWGISLPFWMKASWFKKYGFLKCDKDGMAVLLFKPYTNDAIPPRWRKAAKKPVVSDGAVTVTSFIQGWCSAQNIAHTRAQRVASEFPGRVRFQSYNTRNRATIDEFGIGDALFVDDKEIRIGPPPTEASIRKAVIRQLKKRKL